MKPYPGTVGFTAQICDGDSGALLFPDVETELLTSVDRDGVSIDAIFCRDYRQRQIYVNIDLSNDPWVQHLAKNIRSQALADDEFLAQAYEINEADYSDDSYVRQHRLRVKDVL